MAGDIKAYCTLGFPNNLCFVYQGLLPKLVCSNPINMFATFHCLGENTSRLPAISYMICYLFYFDAIDYVSVSRVLRGTAWNCTLVYSLLRYHRGHNN
jgi:hypothetical protein